MAGRPSDGGTFVIIGMASSVLLILVCILVYYETLRIVSSLLPGPSSIGLRGRMLAVVAACFAAHTIEAWIFAGACYFLADHFTLGSILGERQINFSDLVYFSAVTYSMIGFGDLYAIGGARLLASVEAVIGLLLIGWSASFTHPVMERFWPPRAIRHRPRVEPLTIGARPNQAVSPDI